MLASVRARPGRLTHVVRHLRATVRVRDLLTGVPSFLLAAGFVALAVGFARHTLHHPAIARSIGAWPAYEVVAIVFGHWLLWIFDPRERTPRWQRVIAPPTALVGALGVAGVYLFWRAFTAMWVFIAAKVAALTVAPPSEEDELVGCFRTIVCLGSLLALGLVYVTFFDGRGPVPSMLFGACYFALTGAAEALYRPFYHVPPYEGT